MCVSIRLFFHSIHKQDPLKQGLKPMYCTEMIRTRPIHKQDPLKQGLKLYITFNKLKNPTSIHKQDPLKQGLKLIRIYIQLEFD